MEQAKEVSPTGTIRHEATTACWRRPNSELAIRVEHFLIWRQGNSRRPRGTCGRLDSRNRLAEVRWTLTAIPRAREVVDFKIQADGCANHRRSVRARYAALSRR